VGSNGRGGFGVGARAGQRATGQRTIAKQMDMPLSQWCAEAQSIGVQVFRTGKVRPRPPLAAAHCKPRAMTARKEGASPIPGGGLQLASLLPVLARHPPRIRQHPLPRAVPHPGQPQRVAQQALGHGGGRPGPVLGRKQVCACR